MATIPTLLNPSGSSFLAADVTNIEVTGSDDATLNGVYYSDGASPPVYTQTADTSVNITFNTNLWEMRDEDDSGTEVKWETTLSAATEAPITGNTYLGFPTIWEPVNGSGTVPESHIRAVIPGLLTP